MMKYASLTFALMLGFALSATGAHAQLLTANGTALMDVNTASSVSATTDVTVGASSSPEESVDADTGFNFSFSRKNMNEDTDYAVTDADLVRSSSGFESYAASSVRDDERLQSVTVADSGMDMEYRRSARFLWVIPASMRVDVSVANNGDVTVDYPWYSFLMSTGESRAELETRLEGEIAAIDASMAAAAQAKIDGTATTGIQTGAPTVRRWARILDRMHASLSGSAEVSA